MPSLILIAAAAAQAMAGNGVSTLHAQHATLCLDTLGVNHPPVCRAFNASRIDPAPDICQCLGGGLEVEAPYCASGETPQADTHAYEIARRAAALPTLSLVGKTYNGHSYCVSGPQPPRP